MVPCGGAIHCSTLGTGLTLTIDGCSITGALSGATRGGAISFTGLNDSLSASNSTIAGTVTKVNVANVNSSDFKSRVLTSDLNLVDLHFAVQYQFADPVKTLFRLQDPEATLSGVSESAIREIVGRSTLDEVLVGNTRPEITRRAKELIQRILDEEGVPQELIHLAQAESGFFPRVISRAAAGGMWQFLKWRGNEYGLKQTPYTDDRNDPEIVKLTGIYHNLIRYWAEV